MHTTTQSTEGSRRVALEFTFEPAFLGITGVAAHVGVAAVLIAHVVVWPGMITRTDPRRGTRTTSLATPDLNRSQAARSRPGRRCSLIGPLPSSFSWFPAAGIHGR